MNKFCKDTDEVTWSCV